MIFIKCYCGVFLTLLCRTGWTFVQRHSLGYRLSCFRMDSRNSFQNVSLVPSTTEIAVATRLPSDVTPVSATARFDSGSSDSTSSPYIIRSSYRNGGSDIPLTVSSSIGSHSYRENRPSNDVTERSDRDRERASGNRSSRDRSSSNGGAPFRGRGSSRPLPGAGGPDVIFSTGFDSQRSSQRGNKEAYSSADNNINRDAGGYQKSYGKPWKSRRPFDAAVGGIETAQDYPSNSYRSIFYDHLATSSLEAIEAIPHVKLSKGRSYLSRWWLAAKKWDLLDDELKEVDNAFTARSSSTNSDLQHDQSLIDQGDAMTSENAQRSVGAGLSGFPSETTEKTASKKLTDISENGVSPLTNSDIDRTSDLTESMINTGDMRPTELESINQLMEETISNVAPSETDNADESDWTILENEVSLQQRSEGDRSSAGSISSGGSSSDDLNRANQDNNGLNNDDSSSIFDSPSVRDLRPLENILSVPYDALYSICDRHKARVICIGDVHGCVEELKDLLRAVKYRPGDLVLLLGDLVAKGPSSVEVVRLAMDIGAMSVRGNHDHEVVRQGLKGRSRAFEGGDRDARERDMNREGREREKEREKGRNRDGEGSENSNVNDKDRDSSSGLWNSTRPRSITGNALTGNATGPGTEIPAQKTMSTRVQQHLELGMQLSLKELAWLAELPFYIRSVDLGCVFVHAGFKTGKRLSEQDPWVMMTVRSLLPDGRMSPRCFNRHPWANKWKGPLTAYFGHDAARGLQMYECAVGLDTGCVYGGHLSAVILPEKKFVQVPARKVYQPYGKSRSHKMYAWSNDNETDAESSLPDLDLYEISDSTSKNISAISNAKVQSQSDTATSGIQVVEEQISSVDGVFQENAVESTQAKDSVGEGGSDLVELLKGDLLRPTFTVSPSPFRRTVTPSATDAADASADASSVSKEDVEVNGTINTAPRTTSTKGSAVSKTSQVDPLSSSATTAAFTSAFADSSLAKEIAAALAAPSSSSRGMGTGMGGRVITAASADAELRRLMNKFSELEKEMLVGDSSLMESLLFDTAKSVLSTPRIQQKRDLLSRADSIVKDVKESVADEDRQGHSEGKGERQMDEDEEIISKALTTTQHVMDADQNYTSFVYPPFGKIAADPTPLSPSTPTPPPSISVVDKVSASSKHDKSGSLNFAEFSSDEERVMTLLSKVEGSDPETQIKYILESLQGSGPGSTASQGQGQSKATRSASRASGGDDVKDASHQLLEKFLIAAEVGDAAVTEIVKKALYEVLLLEFGNEHVVLSSLRILLAAEDYMKLDIGRALYALAYDLMKMEGFKEDFIHTHHTAQDIFYEVHLLIHNFRLQLTLGSCAAYVRTVQVADKMSEAKLIELIRIHGSESDLLEFNMRRKPAKEEYVGILFKLLKVKFKDGIDDVADLLESEMTIPVRKGFGEKRMGFGPSTNAFKKSTKL